MKEVIKFMERHCTKEEFIEMIKDTDACPGFFSFVGDPTECINKGGCERCWTEALKDEKFLAEEDEKEIIYQIGNDKIYTAVDEKVIEECTVTKEKEEKNYTFLDVERLQNELYRVSRSGSVEGIEMVERMLEEVKNDVNRRKN